MIDREKLPLSDAQLGNMIRKWLAKQKYDKAINWDRVTKDFLSLDKQYNPFFFLLLKLMPFHKVEDFIVRFR